MAILTYGESTSEAEAYANSDLAKIENWANLNKMKFNERISKTMLIERKRKSNREHISIYLNNRKLQQTTKIKYLGIFFDNKLNIHKHNENITEKSRKLINTLGKTAKMNWVWDTKSSKLFTKGQ